MNDSNDEINRVVNIINNMTDEQYVNIINEPVLIKPFDVTFNKIIIDVQNRISL